MREPCNGQPKAAHPVNDRANILVVDDRPDKHVVYRAILEELGQNLVTRDVRRGGAAARC